MVTSLTCQRRTETSMLLRAGNMHRILNTVVLLDVIGRKRVLKKME